MPWAFGRCCSPITANNLAGGGCRVTSDVSPERFRPVRSSPEMNRVGMLVDCSHSAPHHHGGDGLSTAPVIFTHSNATAVWRHGRNITDDQMKALRRDRRRHQHQRASVSSWATTTSAAGPGSITSPNGGGRQADVCRHRPGLRLRHRRHRGTGRGSTAITGRRAGYPGGIGRYVAPEQLPEIVGMLRRGFNDAEVTGIMGREFSSPVAKAVWKWLGYGRLLRPTSISCCGCSGVDTDEANGFKLAKACW